MMSREVYASVMWALVCATIFSPISFRWALGVYERAFPMERAATITMPYSKNMLAEPSTGDLFTAAAGGSTAAASVSEPPVSKNPSTHGENSTHGKKRNVSTWHTSDQLSHSFGLRIAGKFHWGVNREISKRSFGSLGGSNALKSAPRPPAAPLTWCPPFPRSRHLLLTPLPPPSLPPVTPLLPSPLLPFPFRPSVACLYSLGVYVVEAKVFAIDDPNTKDIDHFIGVYHLLARGKKLDFDEEKLHEMHHSIAETVRDDDAQIIFQAQQAEFAFVSLVEIRLLKITDECVTEIESKLESENLEVIYSKRETSYSPASTPLHSPRDGPALDRSLTRRISKEVVGGHETVPMLGVMESKPHAHTIYLRDSPEPNETHFVEENRERTRELILNIMNAHKLLPPEEAAALAAERERKLQIEKSPKPTRKSGVLGRMSQASQSDAHHKKEHHTSENSSVQVRVMHESEAPADIDLPPILMLPKTAADTPSAVNVEVVTVK